MDVLYINQPWQASRLTIDKTAPVTSENAETSSDAALEMPDTYRGVLPPERFEWGGVF